jgi:putative ABC transport system permease protein
VDTLTQDVRYAIRMLFRRPMFALVAVTAIAIGIGANAAILGVASSALAQRLPFRDADRLVMIWQEDLAHDRDRITLSLAEYDAYSDARGLAGVAAARATAFTATIDGASSVLQGARVTVNLLSMLGATPAAGRDFRPDENQPGQQLVAMLSHGLWLRQFGGDPAIVGRTIVLDEASAGPTGEPLRAPFTIIGILPPDFEIFYTQADVMTPLVARPDVESRSVRGLRVVGRLTDEATLASALDDIKAIDRRISAVDPQPNRGTDVALIPLREEEVGDIRPTMVALGIGAGLVLLVVCANVSNLLLARVMERNRELAVRVALGASTPRLLRLLMTESLVLSAFGAAGGLLLAVWSLDALVALSPAEVLRLSAVRIDWIVVGTTIALAAGTAALCSAGPAWRAAKNMPTGAALARTTSRPESQRLRQLLVASQIALAFVALTSAGLMAVSFIRLRDAAIGFNPANVLTWRLAPPASRFTAPSARSALYRRVLARVESIPGVTAVGAITILPMTDSNQSIAATAPGSRFTDPAHPAVVKLRTASPGFFRALGIPILRGREFRDADVDAGVALASESLARTLWGEVDVVNRPIAIQAGPNSFRTLTVAGVVGDVRQFRDTPAQPTLYASSLGQSSMTFAARSAAPVETLVESVRRALAEVDADLAAYDIQPMINRLDRAGPFTTGWLRAAVGVAFGAICVLLALMGVHAVVRYAVAQQTREIGIRMAVGATAAAIVRSTLRQHLVSVVAGLAIGAVGAFAASRVLAGYLYGVAPANVMALVSVGAMLLVSAALAAWLPARRAASVSPLVALRHE